MLIASVCCLPSPRVTGRGIQFHKVLICELMWLERAHDDDFSTKSKQQRHHPTGPSLGEAEHKAGIFCLG